MASLDAILDMASRSGIRTLVYVAPIRQDVDIPYDADEYAQFKREVEAVVGRHGAEFANLEAIVPAELWGQKDSTNFSGKLELDFMHFQASGHAVLADAVGKIIKSQIDRDPQ